MEYSVRFPQFSKALHGASCAYELVPFHRGTTTQNVPSIDDLAAPFAYFFRFIFLAPAGESLGYSRLQG